VQIANDLGIARSLAADHDHQALGNPWARRDPRRQPPTARAPPTTRQGAPATTTAVDNGEWSIYGYVSSTLSWLLWGTPTTDQ